MMELRELIPANKLAEYHKLSDEMSEKLKALSGTWVERLWLARKLVIWYYERKFIKATKRLTDGI